MSWLNDPLADAIHKVLKAVFGKRADIEATQAVYDIVKGHQTRVDETRERTLLKRWLTRRKKVLEWEMREGGYGYGGIGTEQISAKIEMIDEVFDYLERTERRKRR